MCENFVHSRTTSPVVNNPSHSANVFNRVYSSEREASTNTSPLIYKTKKKLLNLPWRIFYNGNISHIYKISYGRLLVKFLIKIIFYVSAMVVKQKLTSSRFIECVSVDTALLEECPKDWYGFSINFLSSKRLGVLTYRNPKLKFRPSEYSPFISNGSICYF